MELLDLLRADAHFQPFIKPICEDEGICVEVDNSIDEKEIVIIKVDEYYHHQKLEKIPAAVDCFILQYCSEKRYNIYLIELKNVKSPRSEYIDRKQLRDKFGNTLFDFLDDKLRVYFHKTDCWFRIQLLLSAGKVREDSTIKQLRLEFLLSLRPINFKGKLLPIVERKPHPKIETCKIN